MAGTTTWEPIGLTSLNLVSQMLLTVKPRDIHFTKISWYLQKNYLLAMLDVVS